MPATASKKSGEMNRADKRSSITILVLGDGAYRHCCCSPDPRILSAKDSLGSMFNSTVAGRLERFVHLILQLLE
jgi:hypothetical protein